MFDNNDSSDDDDDDGNLSKQVLPTNENFNEPIDMNKFPTTGEEYLRQVRYDNEQKKPNIFLISSYQLYTKISYLII